jgi:hypothetical protein
MHFTMEHAGGVNSETKKAIHAFFNLNNGDIHEGPLPPNMKEITPAQWAWGLNSYSPTAELYIGDVKMDGERWTLYATAYHGGYENHGGGFVRAFHYDWPEHRQQVKFYRWASCEHVREQKNIGRCLNRYTCSKCGHFYDVDSSD